MFPIFAYSRLLRNRTISTTANTRKNISISSSLSGGKINRASFKVSMRQDILGLGTGHSPFLERPDVSTICSDQCAVKRNIGTVHKNVLYVVEACGVLLFPQPIR
jgi:hypothetical protein